MFNPHGASVDPPQSLGKWPLIWLHVSNSSSQYGHWLCQLGESGEFNKATFPSFAPSQRSVGRSTPQRRAVPGALSQAEEGIRPLLWLCTLESYIQRAGSFWNRAREWKRSLQAGGAWIQVPFANGSKFRFQSSSQHLFSAYRYSGRSAVRICKTNIHCFWEYLVRLWYS